VEDAAAICVKGQSLNLPGGTKENHKKPHSGEPVFWMRYKINTS